MNDRHLGESFDRHLQFDQLVVPATASERDRFEAISAALREQIAEQWLATEHACAANRAKQVYYLSMEYLLGRSLRSNVVNLGLETQVREVLRRRNVDFERVCESEPDAGLGNGGLGRLAAWFLDSMAQLGGPAMGYGLRYR